MENAPQETPHVPQQGGLASWEEEALPFRERLQKHWRQMLEHLWGPIGSVLFHVVGILAVLTLVDTGPHHEIVGPETMIEVKSKPELDKAPEPEKTIPQKPPEEVKPMENDTAQDVGFSLADSAEAGGAGNMETGTGLGTGDPNLQDKGFEISTVVKSRLVMKGLYANRTAGGRKGALARYGKGGPGGSATEAAVLRALRWLKKNQESDGSWKGNKIPAPAAMTAMALLAYLAHGETPDKEEFGPTVKKAIDFLLADQEADGHFKSRAQETHGHDYTHPIATYALCEAYGLTQHPSIKDAAVKGITLVVRGQHANGGFNYNLDQSARDDTSYMAWCCQALKAAKMAGLESDVQDLEPAMKKAILGLKLNADPSGGFGYTSPGRTGLSGAGALCMQLLGASRSGEVKRTMDFLAACTFSFTTPKQQPYGGDSPIYYWYYITQAKFHDSPEVFTAWNKLFATELCRIQIVEKNAIEGPDGKMKDIGHWETPIPNEFTGGLVQDTSLCTLMLEVYYRYLPSFKKIEDGPEDVASAPKTEKVDDVSIKIK